MCGYRGLHCYSGITTCLVGGFVGASVLAVCGYSLRETVMKGDWHEYAIEETLG